MSTNNFQNAFITGTLGVDGQLSLSGNSINPTLYDVINYSSFGTITPNSSQITFVTLNSSSQTSPVYTLVSISSSHYIVYIYNIGTTSLTIQTSIGDSTNIGNITLNSNHGIQLVSDPTNSIWYVFRHVVS